MSHHHQHHQHQNPETERPQQEAQAEAAEPQANAEAAEPTPEQLAQRVTELEAELADINKYHQAELQNLNRRHQEEIQAAHKFAAKKFAEELLKVKDYLEMALLDKSGNFDALKMGVDMTLTELKRASSATFQAHKKLSPALPNKWRIQEHHIKLLICFF